MDSKDRVIELLQGQVAELMAWKNSFDPHQQINYPLDLPSKNSLGAYTRFGPGSTPATQVVAVGSTPTTIIVPATPVRTVIIEAEGDKIEVPSYT